jgi:RHS repeat-associated protein
MFKLDLNRAQGPMQMLRALLASALLAVAAAPASAFHFPWDQGHDTTNSNDPPPPGPDDRPPCDPCNARATGSPVYAALGHAIWQDTEVELRGRPYLGVDRFYNSNDPVVGLFGNNWTVDFDIALYPATSNGVQQRIFKAANGKRFVFTRQADGSFLAPASRFETIVEGASTVTMTMLDGQRNVFALDGRLLESWDSNGNRVSFSYDTSARPVRMADDNGRSISIAYNGASLVASVTDHAGRVWRYGYDANANLTTVTDPAAGVRRYAWQAYRPSGDANTYYQLLSVTAASGVVVVSFTYTGGQVASYTQGANRFTYTRPASNTKLAGTVTKRDTLGVATSFTYGALGLITREVDGNGGVTSYTFDNNGRVTAKIDALGRTWSSSYDSLGRLTASTNPLGQTRTVQYAGNDAFPVRQTSPSGRVTSMTYDAFGNQLTSTDPTGAVTRMSYDANGNVTSIVDPLGQTTRYTYNAIGLPVQVIDSLGRTSSTAYDALGRIASTTNAAGETTRYSYDVLDRVIGIVDATNASTAFAYDAAGRLTSVTDAKGSVTRYEYDAFGRRSAEVAPDNRRTTYTYRTDNLLSNITWPDNTSIAYLYDNNKRVIQETAGADVTTYSYNALNQITSSSGPGGTVSYTYDTAGRLASETSGGRTNAIARNADGERTQLTVAGATQTYTRDARGLVTRIAAPAGSFDFSFDALGRRTQLTYPNGSLASYTFDAAGQLTNLVHTGAFNATYAYAFDSAGRITRIVGDGPDWDYTYDSLGRLNRATQGGSTYAYTRDLVGNILDDGRAYDVNHRLVSDNAKNYSYDARGNLVLEQDRSSGARVAYGWNVKNQLLRVDTYVDATSATPSRTLQYTYDPLGRRASKTDNGAVQRFSYDGADLVGVLDAGSTVLATNVFSGAVDEPLATTTAGTAKMLFANHVGSVVGVADGTSLTHSYLYDPFGRTLAGSSADSTPFRYAGREMDIDGLLYYRARYFSSAVQRFVSRDPAGGPSPGSPFAHPYSAPIAFKDPGGDFYRLLTSTGVDWKVHKNLIRDWPLIEYY